MDTYTIEDLVWAIEADRGQFSLFLVRCNYRTLRDEMMQQLRESCDISEMELQPEDESLYWTLKAFVAEENPTALMVYGFENVKNIVELLTSTNNLREKFVEDFKFPVVFWVSDAAIAKFEELAMDFKSFGKPINLPISLDALQTDLHDNIESFFNRILEVGGDRFPTNEEILGSNYRNEIESALADLQKLGGEISEEIEGVCEFIRGRDTYFNHKIDDAIAYYQNTTQLWQNVKEISPLKEAVLQYHLGLCDRALAEEAEEEEKQQSFWSQAKEYFTTCLEKLQGFRREDLAANFINELGEAFLNFPVWQSLKELAIESVTLQKTYSHSLELARAYGFLARVVLKEEDWQEARDRANLALETLGSLPLAERKNKAVYLLLLAQVQEYTGEHDRSFQCVEQSIAIGIEGKPYYFLQLLKELRKLYFSNKHYLDAYKTKIEYQSIRQQYGLTAFVGAGRVKASKTQNFKVSGRQGDVNRLLDRISSPRNKLTIIYGQSGVGKSSLIEAGLVPTLRAKKRIDNRDILVLNLRVYTHWIDDLRYLLVEELERHNKPITLPSEECSLAAVLEQLTVNSNNYLLTILVFDQFEEFFFTAKTSAQQRQFFEFFRDCLSQRFVKVILSLREDYLHLILQGTRHLDLSIINNDILDRYILYYIGNFSKRSAREVIDELTQDSRFRLESDLKTRLIADLAMELDEVRPIELQITGAQLQRENIRNLSQYRQIGEQPTERLVQKYLDAVVRDCGEGNQEIARLVLSLLIDEKNNTRPLKTKQELEEALRSLKVNAIGNRLERLDLVLSIFVLSGLVILLPEKPADRYQLVHDYLVDVIRRQQGASLLAQLKQAEEKMEREKLARLKLLKKSLMGAVVGLVGLTGIASLAIFYAFEARKQTIAAKNQEIVALSQSSKAYYALSPGSLNSLLEALKASVRVKQAEQDIKPENRILAISMLQQAIYEPEIKERNHLEEHQTGVLSVKWSSDGKILASGNWDRTIKIWSREGELLRTLTGHEYPVESVAWNPDGKILASGGGDGVIKIWSREGEFLSVFAENQSSINSVAWSPDGKALASGNGLGMIEIWNQEGKLLDALEGHQDPVESVAWNPDGTILASGSADKTIKIWSQDGELLYTLRGHQDEITSVDWNSDGKMLASASQDRTVKIWSRDGELLYTLVGHQNGVTSTDWNSDGKTLASASWDSVLKIWSRDEEPLYTLVGHQNGVTSADWNSDGKTLASANLDKTIKIWSRKGELLYTLEGHGKRIDSVAWSANGKILASASVDSIKLWSHKGGILKTFKGHQDSVFGLSWSPDSKILASASADKTIKLWSLKGELLHTLNGHEDEVNTIVWNPDGKILASASADKTIRLWSRQGELLKTLKKHKNVVGSVEWSSDGKMLASASADGTLKIWTRNGELLHTLKGHTDFVWSVTWSPDGKILTSTGADKTIKVWTRDGELLHTFTGYKHLVWSMIWSPDGKTLTAIHGDNTLILWFDLDNLLSRSCNWMKDYFAR
ncbi:MAG: hypothetical protein AB4290_28210, partial [Spirulina sp.]